MTNFLLSTAFRKPVWTLTNAIQLLPFALDKQYKLKTGRKFKNYSPNFGRKVGKKNGRSTDLEGSILLSHLVLEAY